LFALLASSCFHVWFRIECSSLLGVFLLSHLGMTEVTLLIVDAIVMILKRASYCYHFDVFAALQFPLFRDSFTPCCMGAPLRFPFPLASALISWNNVPGPMNLWNFPALLAFTCHLLPPPSPALFYFLIFPASQYAIQSTAMDCESFFFLVFFLPPPSPRYPPRCLVSSHIFSLSI